MTEEEVWHAIEPTIKKILLSFVGAGFMVLCVIAGFLIAGGLGRIWPNTLMTSDLRFAAGVSAVVIVGGGAWWYRSSVGGVWTMLGALGLVELVVSTLICYYSGSRVGDPFFLNWFLGLNIFLALPWLGAAALGFLWSRK